MIDPDVAYIAGVIDSAIYAQIKAEVAEALQGQEPA